MQDTLGQAARMAIEKVTANHVEAQKLAGSSDGIHRQATGIVVNTVCYRTENKLQIP